MTDTNTDDAMNAMLGNEPAGGTEDKPKTEESKAKDVTEEATTEEESAQTETEVDALKRESRKWENRAKENKEKADAHDALSTRVSELEGELSAATDKATAAESEVTRWKVASKYGVTEEDVNLFLTASDEETLEKQAQRLSQTSAHAPKPDAAQGTRANQGPTSNADAFAAAISGQL